MTAFLIRFAQPMRCIVPSCVHNFVLDYGGGATSAAIDVQMLLRPALLPRDIRRANDWSLPNCPV